MNIIGAGTLVRDDAKQTYAVGLTSGNNSKVTPVSSAAFTGWLRDSYFKNVFQLPKQKRLVQRNRTS